MSATLTRQSPEPRPTQQRSWGLPTAVASALLWQFADDSASGVCAYPDLDTIVLGPGLTGLERALHAEHTVDIIALAPRDDEQARAAEALVRAAPPRLAVLTVGRFPGIFADAAELEYDVWAEPDPARAVDQFIPLLRSVHEREALTAIRAHRAITSDLDELMDLEGDLGAMVSESMRALATGLQCRAASFWRPSASGASLIRVGCTGPDATLDAAIAGLHTGSRLDCDGLSEIPVADTAAGAVLRTGEPSVDAQTPGSLLLPARANGRVCGVVALSGARAVAQRRTSFELAVSAADRIAALVQAHLSAQQFNAVTARSPLAIMTTNAVGTVVSCNEAAGTLLGIPLEEALDRSAFELLDPDSRHAHAAELRQLIASADGDRPQTVELPLRPLGAPERRLEVSVSAWGDGGDRRYALIASDVTARHRAEQRVTELAYTHHVTRLPNQPALMLEVGRDTRPRGFIAIEVCRFDRVREVVGSVDADDVVRAVAARVVELIGSDGDVHHLGRAEFAVLLDGADRAMLESVAERVAAELAQPLCVRGARLFLRYAVGASLAQDAKSGTDGLDDALRAMRIAREGGSPRPSFHDPASSTDLGRLRREADLHGAASRGELRLHYQPIVDIETGATHAFEALVRWAHPELGLLAPAAFVDIAEESGLISEIGRWVIEETCRQLAAWQRADGFRGRISFNLAPRQLLSGDLATFIEQTISRHRIEPDRLVAEVVESAALQDLAAAARTLAELRRVGLWIALDDFGAGESSLGRLAELPVQILKLDRSLVRGLPDERTSRAITHSATHLARELGLSLVSEGVETEAQREHLRGLPGRYAQGYLFGRPLAPDAAMRHARTPGGFTIGARGRDSDGRA